MGFGKAKLNHSRSAKNRAGGAKVREILRLHAVKSRDNFIFGGVASCEIPDNADICGKRAAQLFYSSCHGNLFAFVYKI
jgi:hypothetical protein